MVSVVFWPGVGFVVQQKLQAPEILGGGGPSN